MKKAGVAEFWLGTSAGDTWPESATNQRAALVAEPNSACAEYELAVSNRLFVGNLSFGTSSSTVESLFAAFGQVKEVAMPTDRETGQPRGFAFVTMSDAKSAADAMAQLNGHNLDGRSLKVDIAQERQKTGGGGGGGNRGGGGRGDRW